MNAMETLTRNNLILLLCLMALMLLYPTFLIPQGLMLYVLLSAVILSGTYSCSFSAKTQRVLLVSGATALATIWLGFFFPVDAIKIVAFGALFAFFAAIVFFLIRHIARSKNVTATLILSSVNGYLLLGLLGALILDIVDIAGGLIETTSGSPAIDFSGGTAASFHDYIYFSFVTLTTLGYGDTTPVSPAAKSICMILAVAGQFYMTVLVAMLVGKYLSRKA